MTPSARGSGIAADRLSGSGDVARALLDELVVWSQTDVSGHPPAMRSALLERLRAAQRAQPSMALVHRAAARALEVTDAGLRRGDGLGVLRERLAEACVAMAADLDAARAATARLAVQLLTERGGWIATLSSSGVVRDAILAAREAGRAPRVIVAESRPGLEGRRLAAALAEHDVPVWLVADAALPLLLSHAAAVWIGADAVTEAGALNKIGSYAAALAAREHAVPVHVLAERAKLLPAATPALRIGEMPPEEIWETPPAGVQPRNVYFELVPIALLRGIVVEDAVLGPTEAAVVARDRALPDELARATE